MKDKWLMLNKNESNCERLKLFTWENVCHVTFNRVNGRERFAFNTAKFRFTDAQLRYFFKSLF